jgi:hypothetical protein
MLENYYGFTSKSDVVKFALLSSSKVTDGVVEVDYSKAQEIIDFVCKNVELPDAPKNFTDDLIKVCEKYHS